MDGGDGGRGEGGGRADGSYADAGGGRAWDASSDSGGAAGTSDAGDDQRADDRDAANASVDAPQVAYIVEGGAWLCTYRSGRKRAAPAFLSLLVGLALALGIGVRRKPNLNSIPEANTSKHIKFGDFAVHGAQDV